MSRYLSSVRMQYGKLPQAWTIDSERHLYYNVKTLQCRKCTLSELKSNAWNNKVAARCRPQTVLISDIKFRQCVPSHGTATRNMEMQMVRPTNGRIFHLHVFKKRTRRRPAPVSLTIQGGQEVSHYQ